MKLAAILFFLGLTLGIGGSLWVSWQSLSDLRGRLDTARNELELADQALVRSRTRVITIEKSIDRGRSGITDSLGKLDAIGQGLTGIQGLAVDSLGILERVRKSPNP